MPILDERLILVVCISRPIVMFLARFLLVAVALGLLISPFGAASVARGDDDPDSFTTADWPSHDWRSPGFVAAVDGMLYDPDCWPLQSVGANVPNLIYRESILQNLDWMRRNKVRWIRVFATGHRDTTDLTADDRARMVKELTRLVEAYNKSVSRSEAIYLVIVLTDYYGQGIPGDVYMRDNPAGCDFVVLPAPWFHHGVQRFNFNPDCGDPPVTDAPNYEVFYKPWVVSLVGDLADSPAIMGWQFGNELKARNNVRNGITEGYDWYLDFVKDMTDAIRAVDKNHLVFVGAQYFGELTDIPYRPGGGSVDPSLRTKYLDAVSQMARACGYACWNVWPLTFYDFNSYPADDAMILSRGSVATLATEFGFTLSSSDQEKAQFGGDRVAALRAGFKKPWQDIDGQWHDTQWNVADSLKELQLSGAAPWGSPYPNPETDLGNDLDRRRGISLAPEGMALWQTWTGIAADQEYLNARVGPSDSCLAASDSGRPLGGPPAPRPSPVPPLMAKPSASPMPPLLVNGTITGISTDVNDPTLIVKANDLSYRLRLPKDQTVKKFSVGDNVRVSGWPMGDGVMLMTSIEVVYGR